MRWGRPPSDTNSMSEVPRPRRIGKQCRNSFGRPSGFGSMQPVRSTPHNNRKLPLMSAKNYSLNFDGYWREPNVGGLPAKSGIYGVYGCVYDATAKTVSLNRL